MDLAASRLGWEPSEGCLGFEGSEEEPRKDQLCSWRLWAWGSQVFYTNTLGLAGLRLSLLGKGHRRLSNLLAHTAGSPTHLGLEMDSRFCLLGPRGQGCGGAMGP